MVERCVSFVECGALFADEGINIVLAGSRVNPSRSVAVHFALGSFFGSERHSGTITRAMPLAVS
jgi:hypothetical protein